MKTCLTLLFIIAWSASLHAGSPNVGSRAPDLTVPNQDGQRLHFRDFYAKNLTLICFFPLGGWGTDSETTDTMAELTALRDAYAKLQLQGVQIIGITPDTQEVLKAFRLKNKLPFQLIADGKNKASEAFNVPMYGGGDTPHRYERVTFLIKGSKIVWMSSKPQTTGEADEVLKVLDSLK